MKKTLRTLISLALALAVTSAGAVQIGCPGLEKAPAVPAAQANVNGS